LIIGGNVIKRWMDSGLLDGLTGMDEDNPMLKVFETIKEQKINEQSDNETN
jgi:hypothetical protein